VPDTARIVEREVEVTSELGFHMRPMQRFIEILGDFKADVQVRRAEPIDGGPPPTDVDGRSIFGLMELAAAKGSKLVLTGRGDDSDSALETLAEFFARSFDE
jgi:phosphocarrier protein